MLRHQDVIDSDSMDAYNYSIIIHIDSPGDDCSQRKSHGPTDSSSLQVCT